MPQAGTAVNVILIETMDSLTGPNSGPTSTQHNQRFYPYYRQRRSGMWSPLILVRGLSWTPVLASPSSSIAFHSQGTSSCLGIYYTDDATTGAVNGKGLVIYGGNIAAGPTTSVGSVQGPLQFNCVVQCPAVHPVGSQATVAQVFAQANMAQVFGPQGQNSVPPEDLNTCIHLSGPSVVTITSNAASSSWCTDVDQGALGCCNATGHPGYVFPIFYSGQPTLYGGSLVYRIGQQVDSTTNGADYSMGCSERRGK